MQASNFFKCLGDLTRLKLMLLVRSEGELCVCEFAAALGDSQPKISRHLSQLRACELLQDRRRGQWVFYSLHPQLPDWCHATLKAVQAGNPALVENDLKRLADFGDGPDRTRLCC